MDNIIFENIKKLDSYYKKIKELSIQYADSPSEDLRTTLDTLISKYNVLFTKLDHDGYIQNTKYKLIDYEYEVSLRVPSSNKFIHLKKITNVKKINITKKDVYNLNGLILQLKYDGVSMIIWRGPNFTTKGNLFEGKLRNEMLKLNPDLNKKVEIFFNKNPTALGIRGEILLNNSYNTDDKSPVSNLMSLIAQKNKTKKDISILSYVFYEIIYNTEIEPTTYLEDLELFEQYNFEIPNSLDCSDIDELSLKNFDKYIDKLKNVNYSTDGIIIIDNKSKKKTAIKKKSDPIITTVRNISFNIKKEAIIPILEIEPITASGKTFTKLTMSNINKLLEHKVKPKDEITCSVIAGGFLQFINVCNLKTKRNEIAYIKFLEKILPSVVKYIDNVFIVTNLKNDDIIYFITKLKIPGYGEKKIKNFFSEINLDIDDTESALNFILTENNELTNKIQEKILETPSLELAIMIVPVAGFTTNRMISKISNQYQIETNNKSLITLCQLKNKNLIVNEIDIKLKKHIKTIVKYYNILQTYKNKFKTTV